MENVRLSKTVQSVVMLQQGPSGTYTRSVIYKKPGKGKKGSRASRPFEKAERRFASAQRAYWDDYLSRHDRSNQKRRDGWARDFPVNVAKASRKSYKELNRGR
jgi:hypothetical protein